MKMLLGALGYDAATEGYTGANWGVNVAKQAVGIGLNKGNDDFVGTKAVTREEAALYAFNTLKATMVEYKNASSITIGDITIANNVVATDVAQSPYVEYGGGSASTLQFCEKNFPNLKMSSDSNSLKQVTNKWKLKSTTIGSYAVGAASTAVVSDSGKTLGDIVTGASYMNYSSNDIALQAVSSNFYAYINGDIISETSQSAVLDNTTLKKGDVVYAYTNSDGDVTKLVVARYTYAKIDSVVTKLGTAEIDAGATTRLKLLDIDENAVGTFYDDNDTASKKLNGFSASTYVEGATLAIAQKSDGTIVDSYVIEAVAGKPSAAKEATNGFITVGGTKYNYTGAYAGLGTTSGQIDFDNEYEVYTTKEGYVIAVKGTAAANLDDIYYVTGIYTKASAYGEADSTYWVQRVSLDGTIDAVQVEKGSLQRLTDNATVGASTSWSSLDDDISNGTAFAGLYTFDDNYVAAKSLTTGASVKDTANNGVLSITAFDDNALVTRDYDEDTNTIAANTVVKADATKVSLVTGTPTYYITNSTKIVALSGAAGSALESKSAVGGLKVTVGGSAANVIVIYDKDDGKTANAIIYLTNSTASSTSTNVVYVGTAASVKNANNTYSGTIWFMEDNHDETVTLASNYANGFYTYSLENNVYTLYSLADLTLAADYDDEVGAKANVVVSSVYKSNKFTTGTSYFEDINFNGVTIIDNRSASDKAADAYTVEINSIADLKDAVAAGKNVTVDIYLNKGATFIAVDSMDAGFALTTNFSEENGVTATLDSPSTGTTVGGTTVTVKLTGTATAAKTMQIKANNVVLASVAVEASQNLTSTPVYLTFAMPSADAELSLASAS
jgi:hypothetical protein